MLIGRAPLRVSFGGGGTDIEAYYADHEGFVLSAAINKYVYGILTANHDAPCQVISADFQKLFREGDRHDDGDELRLARAVLDEFTGPRSLNIFLASEVPPGTGLGSSGSVAVNLIQLLSTLSRRSLNRREIAELAYDIEVNRLGAPVGKQDQYAAAFGGLNIIRFNTEEVVVEPVSLPAASLATLQNRLMLFYTGDSRHAWEILRTQKAATSGGNRTVIASLDQIKALACEMHQALLAAEFDEFGRLMDESWQLKKQLTSKISSGRIDAAYAVARDAGALGGKIAGAGGGGFMLVYCNEDRQTRVRDALADNGLHQMHFGFDFEGVRVLLNAGPTSEFE